jgi:hypothetical protein
MWKKLPYRAKQNGNSFRYQPYQFSHNGQIEEEGQERKSGYTDERIDEEDAQA